mgnify:CR=1 FL=1
MSDASSSDPYVLGKFCQSTLNRVNLSIPLQSALILQSTPPAQGGTANHPFKIADSAVLAGFRDAVVALGQRCTVTDLRAGQCSPHG